MAGGMALYVGYLLNGAIIVSTLREAFSRGSIFAYETIYIVWAVTCMCCLVRAAGYQTDRKGPLIAPSKRYSRSASQEKAVYDMKGVLSDGSDEDDDYFKGYKEDDETFFGEPISPPEGGGVKALGETTNIIIPRRRRSDTSSSSDSEDDRPPRTVHRTPKKRSSGSSNNSGTPKGSLTTPTPRGSLNVIKTELPLTPSRSLAAEAKKRSSGSSTPSRQGSGSSTTSRQGSLRDTPAFQARQTGTDFHAKRY
jgi:hypothetical protein